MEKKQRRKIVGKGEGKEGAKTVGMRIRKKERKKERKKAIDGKRKKIKNCKKKRGWLTSKEGKWEEREKVKESAEKVWWIDWIRNKDKKVIDNLRIFLIFWIKEYLSSQSKDK